MEMGEVLTDALPSNRNIQNSSFSSQQPELQEDTIGIIQTGEIVPVEQDSWYYDMRGHKYLFIFNHEVYQSTVHYSVKEMKQEEERLEKVGEHKQDMRCHMDKERIMDIEQKDTLSSENAAKKAEGATGPEAISSQFHNPVHVMRDSDEKKDSLKVQKRLMPLKDNDRSSIAKKTPKKGKKAGKTLINSESPDTSATTDNMVQPNVIKPIIRQFGRYFDMRGHKYLHIFNHEEFQSTIYFRYKPPSPRTGTQVDVDDLTTTFTSMGYNVQTYHNYTHDQIIRTVKNISQQDHSRTSCVWIAVLTHGKESNKLCAADKYYKLSELERLLQDGNLVGKPKVMLVQACRAGHVDSGRSLKLSSGKTVQIPTPADFLIMHATYDDFYAFRNDGGTFLINAVCEAFNENEEMSYGDFIAIVNHKVGSRTTTNSTNPLYHNKKQIPDTRVTLMKSLIFKKFNVAPSNNT